MVGGHEAPTRAKSSLPVIGWRPTICPRNEIAPHLLGGSWKRRAASQRQRAPPRRLFSIDRQQHSKTAQRFCRARRQASALPVASMISTPRSPDRPVDEAIRFFPQTTSSTRVKLNLLIPVLTTVVSFSQLLAISRSSPSGMADIASAKPALISHAYPRWPPGDRPASLDAVVTDTAISTPFTFVPGDEHRRCRRQSPPAPELVMTLITSACSAEISDHQRFPGGGDVTHVLIRPRTTLASCAACRTPGSQIHRCINSRIGFTRGP